ncbi:MAG: D-alanyl-D-alanine carboxypeptidase family protein [Oscillospiraceae bacterium]
MHIKGLCSAALSAAVFLSGVFSIGCCGLTEADISAKAAVVYEPTTGRVLFEKNKSEKLPMASTTKIMTTLLLIENGELDTPFTVDSEAIKVEGSSMGLTEGDIVTGRDLCAGMLLPSGNDAANASAVHVSGSMEKFAELMNFRAGLIGMRNTHFVTPSGLHDDDHYSTAYDMALLASEALKDPVFAEICGSSSMKVHFGAPPYDRWLKNTNKLLTMCEGCIGVKTGFTDEAGRCLVSACERNGVTLVCVTLNDRNDWQDHINMYDDAFSRIMPIEIDIGEVYENVAGSDTSCVELVNDERIIYPSADGHVPEIECKIIAPHFVYAPVQEGDIIGSVQIYADGKLLGEYELKAAQSAAYEEVGEEREQTLWERIRALIFG